MNDDFYSSYKIVVLGESCIGKTNVILRMCGDPYDENQPGTVGASFVITNVTIDNKIIKLEIWDTISIERYRSLNRIFLKNADVVLFVYNVGYRRSFDEIKAYYYENVIKYLDDASIIIY